MNKNVIIISVIVVLAYFFLRKKKTETTINQSVIPGATPRLKDAADRLNMPLSELERNELRSRLY